MDQTVFSGSGADDPVAYRRWITPLNVGLLVGALLAASLIIVLIIQVAASNTDRDRALERERHSYDVMLVTRSIDSAMARAEASLGRFATSGDRGMGTSYYNDWLQAGTLITQLQDMASHDPDEARLVRQLRTLYDARGRELGLTATRAYYKQGWPALLLFNNAGHSKLISDIKRSLDAITEHERDVLQSRYDQSDAAASQSNHLAKLLSLTGVLLVVAAGILAWLAWNAIITRRHAREEAEAADDRAAWLEHAVAERTRALSDANDRLHREMTERAAAEAQLRQMQKMEAVGQLTGGIAHDFNNMLAVVVGGLDLAKRRLETEAEEVGRHIDNAMEGANRAAALTRRLLGFARAEPLLPEAINPSELIEGMSELIDRTLGERVTVETIVERDVWPVWVDPLQLENAILNLAVNARDAMDGAGRLEIAVANCTLAAREVGQAPAGDYVRIAVTDTGSGMTPEVQERVFEPFFTTKPVGKGTGLGLSQIFGFVRQSAGEVAIRSAVGEGTTVSLYLPRGRGKAMPVVVPATIAHRPPERLPVRTPEPADPQGEPVLVVEDDPRVRVATIGAIEELGYRAIGCSSGEEALDLLAREGDIRLMITDVVMPGMTGPELGAAVRKRHPHIAILFVTGYAGEAGESDLAGQAVLRKPFTVSALERAVGDALASAPPLPRGAAAAE
ncbi:ATP-binding protein [Sphingomonas sp. PR090111-T3T-6A]|uniref:ATP-binding protein n=1 Tax=Sphingomonas sp. PR090111-T3T-6A TaxID=685778 RepID=UPI000381A38A|nr:ATP-binding protein [Sphingomonas sp. PR090111-T3T-6A]